MNMENAQQADMMQMPEQQNNQALEALTELFMKSQTEIQLQEMSSFLAKQQMRCQQYCEQRIRQDIQERDNIKDELTPESVKALEKQCNKLCGKKIMRAYNFMSENINTPIQNNL